MDIRFIWDENKNKSNQRKHRVSFEEAKTVFLDECARSIYDPDHSETEERFILLGMSGRFRVLVVCHCYRKNEEVIRIISARRATTKEEKRYYEKRV